MSILRCVAGIRRPLVLVLVALTLTSCQAIEDLQYANPAEKAQRYQVQLAQAEREMREARPMLQQFLGIAAHHPAGLAEGLKQFPLNDLVRPLTARLNHFEARLQLRRLQEAQNKNHDGVVFASIPCYVEQGDISVTKAGECLFSGLTWPPKPLQMVAAVPLGINGLPIVDYSGGRQNLLEFVTHDPNQPEESQTYFFGDPLFSLAYFSVVADATSQGSAFFNFNQSDEAGAAALLAAVTCAFNIDGFDNEIDEFVCKMGRLMEEAAKGGGALIAEVMDQMG